MIEPVPKVLISEEAIARRVAELAEQISRDYRRMDNLVLVDVRSTIAGKHVLVVEDIVDTGRTLDYLMRLLGARGPASLAACALVRKPDRLQIPVRLAYLGFDIPDRWVVGYGLDLGERHRTLPYIGRVEGGPEPILHAGIDRERLACARGGT